MPELKKPPIAAGVTAEVYSWKDGQVLKLFRHRSPTNALELSTTRVASTCLPVPAVIGGLIEVEGREGIILERINGPTMSEYLLKNPESAVDCALQMANLHAKMHQQDVSDSLEIDRHSRLTKVINLEHGLPPDIRKAVLRILDDLPRGKALYHGDFHPANIIMATEGPVIIDWGTCARGNPLADFAMTWILSRFFPVFGSDPDQIAGQFWRTYLNCYRELRYCSEDELVNWQIVQAAGKLSFGQHRKVYPPERCEALLEFVQSMLGRERIAG